MIVMGLYHLPNLYLTHKKLLGIFKTSDNYTSSKLGGGGGGGGGGGCNPKKLNATANFKFGTGFFRFFFLFFRFFHLWQILTGLTGSC